MGLVLGGLGRKSLERWMKFSRAAGDPDRRGAVMEQASASRSSSVSGRSRGAALRLLLAGAACLRLGMTRSYACSSALSGPPRSSEKLHERMDQRIRTEKPIPIDQVLKEYGRRRPRVSTWPSPGSVIKASVMSGRGGSERGFAASGRWRRRLPGQRHRTRPDSI